MKDNRYVNQVKLMLKTIPHVTAEPGFALKAGRQSICCTGHAAAESLPAARSFNLLSGDSAINATAMTPPINLFSGQGTVAPDAGIAQPASDFI